LKSRQQSLPYNTITRLFIPVFFFCVRNWPRWFSRAVAWPVTSIYYPFFINRRHSYQSNLKHILGEDADNWTLFACSFRMCVNYAYYLIDLFRYNGGHERELDEILSDASGYDNIKDALARGKGAILLTVHMGNWELGGIVLSKLGHPVNVVYFPDGSSTVEENRTRERLMRGVKEIRLDPDRISPLAMMRALDKNELVALQGDKMFHDSGVKVPFFGVPAYFPKGPVLLSMMTGAPILPSFIVMDKNAKYNIIVDEPIYPVKTGGREKDIEENLKKVVKVFEKYIGVYYEQWYSFTKFWDD